MKDKELSRAISYFSSFGQYIIITFIYYIAYSTGLKAPLTIKAKNCLLC